MFVHFNGPKLPKCANTENHDRMELSCANHVYNTEFSVETSLDHGFLIENTYKL